MAKFTSNSDGTEDVNQYETIKSQVGSLTSSLDACKKKIEKLQGEYDKAASSEAKLTEKIHYYLLCMGLFIVSCFFVSAGLISVILVQLVDDGPIWLLIGLMVFPLVGAIILYIVAFSLGSAHGVRFWKKYEFNYEDVEAERKKATQKKEGLISELKSAKREEEKLRADLDEKQREMDRFLMGL